MLHLKSLLPSVVLKLNSAATIRIQNEILLVKVNAQDQHWFLTFSFGDSSDHYALCYLPVIETKIFCFQGSVVQKIQKML